MQNDRAQVMKFLLVGPTNTGKSNIFRRFTTNTYVHNSLVTLGADYASKTVQVQGKMVKLQIWDTSGVEGQRKIAQSYCKRAHGIVLVYDITQRFTFESLSNWIVNIKKLINQNTALILVGNKSDDQKNRSVSNQQGQALANSLNIMFYESSALDSVNIDCIFTTLVNQVKYQQYKNNDLNTIKKQGPYQKKELMPEKPQSNEKKQESKPKINNFFSAITKFTKSMLKQTNKQLQNSRIFISELKKPNQVLVKKMPEQKFENQEDKPVQKKVPSFLQCPISYELMKDPVLLTVCGHTFESTLIREWVNKNASCPLCKKPINNPESMLIQNFAILNALEEYKLQLKESDLK